MKKIVIIAAMEQELAAIKNKFENIEEKEIKDLIYYEGLLNARKYILIKSGIGKVNAARTTQMLIDYFDIEYIINVGTAGSLNNKLEIGDIVIGKDLVQHDFDTTAFGDEKGYITGTGKIFKSDNSLIKRYNISNGEYNILVGTIATGDIFCTEKWMKEKIREEFEADCVEMEGAAIAQVCKLNKIPFVIIRSISDKPNGENAMDFNKFIGIASKRCADLIFNK